MIRQKIRDTEHIYTYNIYNVAHSVVLIASMVHGLCSLVQSGGPFTHSTPLIRVYNPVKRSRMGETYYGVIGCSPLK